MGRPGSGKTYSLTERCITEARRGRRVFANFTINHPNCYRYRYDQLMDLPSGVIAIDEAHLWFSARHSIMLPPEWLAEVSQTRKNGWDLYWTSQHESRVDLALRHVTDTQWLCSSWFTVAGHPLLFVSDAYEPEYFRKKGRRVMRRYRFFNEDIAQSFNTYERLTIGEHMQRKPKAAL